MAMALSYPQTTSTKKPLKSQPTGSRHSTSRCTTCFAPSLPRAPDQQAAAPHIAVAHTIEAMRWPWGGGGANNRRAPDEAA
jgi:hypothetical protein